ncbi:MAG TPA: bifunctional glutamate N-acetyltransferase/amino-acid acetyltransferase ArgJ [Candidatus Omnitrophota bacterium]|nr:bifunctional glutamate N-acetyltransferase/amino-acid acetyltransferase ArgJ [Candidatus Omnitrophota bacterium]
MSISLRSALPLGFKAFGVSANIKKNGKKDLALFYSEAPCVVAGMFTENSVKAAPVLLCEKVLKSGSAVHAVIANSGNANCMTGLKGVKNAEKTAALAAGYLGIDSKEVLVSSTGIIGKHLPVEKIEKAMSRLVSGLSKDSLKEAAEAIMTTDTFAKIVVKQLKIGSKVVMISGVAKGAGMIAPKMQPADHATMLSYIMTDACILKKDLQLCLNEAVEPSFNSITIDGCMSTNDTVILMANGESGTKPLAKGSADLKKFCAVLKEVCLDLAKMVVFDGEGASKFIEIRVKGASNRREAKAFGMSIANYNLFKCAMFGSDPNWGRIAAALGSMPSKLKWEKIDIELNGRPVFRKGKPVELKEKDFLKEKNITVSVDLKMGSADACVYTSDLSYEYVRINADYS